MEDVHGVLTLVSLFVKDVGFPIAVSAFLMWERHTTMRELRDHVRDLLDIVKTQLYASHNRPAN